MKGAFTLFDANDDGKISISELRRVIEAVGKKVSDQDLRDMVKILRKFNVSE